MIMEGNMALRPSDGAKDGESTIIDGGVNEGESIITGGCAFDGVGVLSRTIAETGASSRTVGVVGCEEQAGLRETGVGGNLSVTSGKFPEGNFGDDLSAVVNGVSGIGDGGSERACSVSSS
jgi:hypothetical protein